MNHLKQKIKLSIPIVVLYNQYTNTVDAFNGIDKSVLSIIRRDIDLIPSIIDKLNMITTSSAEDMFKISHISNTYDITLLNIYTLFDTSINVSISSNTLSSNMSNAYVKKTNSMFTNILASYNIYINHIFDINDKMLNDMVVVISKLPDNDIYDMYKKYTGSSQLYGKFIQYRLNEYGISYMKKQLYLHKLSDLKNSLFCNTMQQSVNEHNPPLQNIQCIPSLINKSVAEVIKICFNKTVDDNSTYDTIDVLAQDLKIGVLCLVRDIPNNYIYDLSKLMNVKDHDKNASTVISCITEQYLDTNDTIKRDHPSDKYYTGVKKCGDLNEYKWIMLSTNSEYKTYTIYSRNGSHYIHRPYIERILRGPSIRIESINARSNDIFRKHIHDGNIEDEPDDIDIARYISLINDAVVLKFISLVGNSEVSNVNDVKKISMHGDLNDTVISTLYKNIDVIDQAHSPEYKTELVLSTLTDVSNIIKNIQISIGLSFDRLNINPIIFQEYAGEDLRRIIISTVAPIYNQIITDALSSKADIFGNTLVKNRQLNTTLRKIYN